jgi:UDP-N-acetyl-D-galactosamine dehydrogenase
LEKTLSKLNECHVAVIGLGYVGLPLAVEFSRKWKTIGYDISEKKIRNLGRYTDPTGEVDSEALRSALDSGHLEVTTSPDRLAHADYFIVAVPTPVDQANVPDFSPLVAASTIVGRQMKSGVTVVYESTVYPGATEEVCVPVLERESGLRWKQDFHVGYSPERVNPGDAERTITKIVKVVSGDDSATLEAVSNLYGSIIEAGVFRASSIKVAEAAKVIENTQRDLNIALMNELAIIFDRLDIETSEVLQAAGTKWNFLPFRPGLVGGHCIGVDPYYLTYKAEMVGYHPQVILAGRRINDSMATHVAQQTVKRMIVRGSNVKGAKVVVLGLTFKENCKDLRNSKVIDLINELQDYGCDIFVHDPIADPMEVSRELGVELSHWVDLPQAEAIIAAVPHDFYLNMPLVEIATRLKPSGVFIDVKSSYPKQALISMGFAVWRL